MTSHLLATDSLTSAVCLAPPLLPCDFSSSDLRGFECYLSAVLLHPVSSEERLNDDVFHFPPSARFCFLLRFLLNLEILTMSFCWKLCFPPLQRHLEMPVITFCYDRQCYFSVLLFFTAAILTVIRLSVILLKPSAFKKLLVNVFDPSPLGHVTVTPEK